VPVRTHRNPVIQSFLPPYKLPILPVSVLMFLRQRKPAADEGRRKIPYCRSSFKMDLVLLILVDMLIRLGENLLAVVDKMWYLLHFTWQGGSRLRGLREGISAYRRTYTLCIVA
jgi:hypothetical protein